MSIAAHIARLQRRVTNIDPTRTLAIRNVFIADQTRRYRALMRVIIQSVVTNDALNLSPPLRDELATMAVAPIPAGAFDALTSTEKIAAFNVWLIEQERQGVLEIIPGPQGPEPYSNQYIRSSYQKGLDKSLRELRAKGIEVPATVLPGAPGVGGVFLAPFHQSRVQLIYGQTFTALERVTEVMNTQIQGVLAQGIAEGVGLEEMARRINNRVDKIGLTRSKLIARTETVKTYNTAQVFEFQRVENIIGEEIFVQWWTAEDERVRSSHRERHGKIYTKADYLTLIGEPNCRCTGLPYVESVDGEADKTTADETRTIEAEQVAKEKQEAAQRKADRQRERLAAQEIR